jgi:hypothetical protein
MVELSVESDVTSHPSSIVGKLNIASTSGSLKAGEGDFDPFRQRIDPTHPSPIRHIFHARQ